MKRYMSLIFTLGLISSMLPVVAMPQVVSHVAQTVPGYQAVTNTATVLKNKMIAIKASVDSVAATRSVRAGLFVARHATITPAKVAWNLSKTSKGRMVVLAAGIGVVTGIINPNSVYTTGKFAVLTGLKLGYHALPLAFKATVGLCDLASYLPTWVTLPATAVGTWYAKNKINAGMKAVSDWWKA